MFKGVVATLKELKGEIESLQARLLRSQENLQADFHKWHVPALAEARRSAAAATATANPLNRPQQGQRASGRGPPPLLANGSPRHREPSMLVQAQRVRAPGEELGAWGVDDL